MIKQFVLLKTQNMMDVNVDLHHWSIIIIILNILQGINISVYKFFHKKTSGSGIKNKNISNKELAEELQKLIIRKFNKRKVHSLYYRQYFGSRSSRYAIDK